MTQKLILSDKKFKITMIKYAKGSNRKIDDNESKEATVKTGHGTTDWFQIGTGVHQYCILSPAYLTYMQSTSCEMLSWINHKLKSRFLGEISITSYS